MRNHERGFSSVACVADKSLSSVSLMMNGVHVVMLAPIFDASVGGMEKQALTLAIELLSQGIVVSGVNKRRKRTKGAGIGDEERQGADSFGGVKVVHLPTLHRLPGWSLLVGFLVWAFIHRRDFHLIHAHNASLGVIGCLIGWVLRKKVVVKIPSRKNVIYFEGSSLARRLRRWTLIRRVDRFVVVSTEIAQLLQAQGIRSDRIALIPNGVEFMPGPPAAERGPLKMQLLGDATAQTVLFVGRLVEEKGLDRLLTVWQALPCRERARLCIVGDGPLRHDLERLAQALGLLASVRFFGHRRDVTKFYAIADLFVLPSKTEGMSNALLEALAAGLPVMASNVGGNRDVITDGQNGFLVDWSDAAACTQLMVTLLTDQHLRQTLGSAAKARAHDFTLPHIAERYRRLYHSVLQLR